MGRVRWLSAALLSVALACGAPGGPPGAISASVPPPPPPPPTVTVEILTYNTWLLPPLAPDRAARASAMPDHLLGQDVLVLTEAFDDDVRPTLVAALEEHGYQATPALGSGVDAECGTELGPVSLSVSLGLNGGVVVLGRHRLERWEQRLFGSACTGEDCCAAKGVLYARFRTGTGLCLHVFGTHLQNQDPEIGGDAPGAVRRRQLEVVRDFADEMVDQAECPGPVFIAGDLNLGREELAEAAGILRARLPEHFEGPRSWGEHNRYERSDTPERLDYVLATKDYAPPVYSSNETRIFRSAHELTRGNGLIGLTSDGVLADLSDHHPVAGRFEWGSPASRHRLWWTLGTQTGGDACVRMHEVPDAPGAVGGYLCATPELSLEWAAGGPDERCATMRDCREDQPAPGSTRTLCSDRERLVWCSRGLGQPPCTGLDSKRRCIQVVDPEAADESGFDDFLCYAVTREVTVLEAPCDGV